MIAKRRFQTNNGSSKAKKTTTMTTMTTMTIANESPSDMAICHRKIFRTMRSEIGTIARHLLMGVTLMMVLIQGGCSIDCFKCVSYNGANKACDDPFHNNYSTSIQESPCMGGRKGRDGLFPATACIKIAGYYDDTGETITVRGCALDSGTLTTDTEIIRMSHCGEFYFDDRYVHGCLQSCSDADACNSAPARMLPFLHRKPDNIPFYHSSLSWWPTAVTMAAIFTITSSSLQLWWQRISLLAETR